MTFRVNNTVAERVFSDGISSSGNYVYYVDPSGSDLNPGSFEKPFKTITFAIQNLNNVGGEITVINVLAGLYYEDMLHDNTFCSVQNCSLNFETGSVVISETGSIGIQTTTQNSSVSIYGAGIFSSSGGGAFKHTGLGVASIHEAFIFETQFANANAIEGCDLISNVKYINVQGNPDTSTGNAVIFKDLQNGDVTDFQMYNIGHISSDGTCVRIDLGNDVANNYSLTVSNVTLIECNNSAAENCVETSPIGVVGATVKTTFKNCFFKAIDFNNPTAADSCVNVTDTNDIFLYNCSLLSTGAGCAVQAGGKIFIYNCQCQAGFTLTVGAGSYGIANSICNNGTTGVGTVLFDLNNSVNAAIEIGPTGFP